MSTSRTTCAVVIGLIAMLLTGVAMPGQAAYTKLYYAKNETGVYQSSLQAVTNGLESIVAETIYPGAWGPAAVGFAVTGGVPCTTLTIGGSPWGPSKLVKIGWTTADGSCRLRDLRWGGGEPVVPYYEGGVPGGGMVFYNYPNPGDLTVVITNDTDGVIALSDIGFAISGHELSLEELDSLLDVGFVELRVASIDDDIDALRTDVAYYGSLGYLPSPSVNSIDQKLESAAAYKEAGLTEYLAGDASRASFLWAKAAKQVESVISQVTNLSDKGNLAEYLYERWVTGVAGGPTTAPEIRDALLALPEGQALESFEPLPGDLPAYPGLNPANCVEWPQDELYPGEFTAFVVHGMDLGAGFIMGGSVLDGNGNVVLEWLEQSVAEPTVTFTGPPEILEASADPEYLWPPDHSVVNMALSVEIDPKVDPNGPPPDPSITYATWYVADVASNQPDNGTGDGDSSPDWWINPDDPQSLWLRAERSGADPTGVREYTITLMAINMAGDVSEQPWLLVVPVDHDQG